MSHKSSLIVYLLLLGVLAPACHAYLFNHPSYHHHHRGLDDLLSFGRAHNPYESLSRRPQPRYECPPPLKHQRLHISETDEAYLLKVTLPGVHKRDISVDIDGTTLKLKALRMPQSGCEYNGGRYDAYGRFLPNAEEWREVVQLPVQVYHLPTELVSASFQHQQLVITVHKPGVAREVAPAAATAAASPTAAAAPATATAPASPAKAEPYTAAGPHSASPASAASRPTQRAASSSPPQHNAQQQHQRQQQPQRQQQHQQPQQRQQQQQQPQQCKQQDAQKPLDFSWDSFERILSKFLVYVTPGTASTSTSTAAASSPTDYDPDVFSGTDPRFYSIPVENTEAKPDSDSALVEDAPIQLDLLLH